MKLSFRQVNRYREIVETLARHGFGFLLDQLGIRHMLSLPVRLLRRNEPPPRLSAPTRVRLVLERLGPTFVKLGQILSTRSDLVPPEYLEELERLQDQVPPARPKAIRALIAAEQGRPVEELFRSFEEQPIASASLGQVHAAILRSGERVVVKVQRPGVEEIIRTDLEILRGLAGLIDRRSPWAEVYDFRQVVEEFTEILRDELDYTAEARNAEHFRANFSGDPTVLFPRFHPEFTTRRMLVLEFVEGVKISELGELRRRGADLPALARAVLRAILKQVLIDGFFHGDPHPGNLLVTPDGRVAFLDLGMTGQLDRRTRRRLVQLMLGIIDRDAARVVRAMVALGVTGTETRDLERDVARVIGRYYHLPLKEFNLGEAMDLAMRLAFRHHLQLPADLTLMAKTLSVAEAVARRLDPPLSLVEIAEPFKPLLVREHFSWAAVREWAEVDLREYGASLAGLPVQLNRVFSRLERGEVTLRLEHGGVNEFAERVAAMVNRLTISILITGIIVGTALLGRQQEPLAVFHVGLTRLGFATALGLGLWLIVSILRSGRG